jgi:hypothetical protein
VAALAQVHHVFAQMSAEERKALVEMCLTSVPTLPGDGNGAKNDGASHVEQQLLLHEV